LNAPYVLPRAAHAALLAGDAAGARAALDRLAATGAHGRAIDVDRVAIQAGLAVLQGRRAEGITGYRSAIAGWRDLGLPWDEAVTSIAFVRLVGPDEPEAVAAAEAARGILEGLGAVRVLDILNQSMRPGDDARLAAPPDGGRARAGADRATSEVPAAAD
jgi:hypothetical protein